MTFSSIFNLITSIPKTIYFNFKVFPYSTALKLPVIISRKTKLAEVHKGGVQITQGVEIRFGMIKIGFGGTEGIEENCVTSYIQIDPYSKLVFGGTAFFAKGTTIRINNSNVFIGNNFWSNRKFLLSSHSGIKIGNDFLSGWNVAIQDSSNHYIVDNGVEKAESSEIIIGDHVWVASNVTCLKGTVISDNSVVATGAVVTKPFHETGILLGGVVARIIQKDINWKK